jgi:UDP-galactopyranose mutase
MRRVADVDTQVIRAKLLRQLEQIFDLAISIAKGQVKHFRDDKGRMHQVTPKQRERWARIASYAAQVMTNLTKGFDEKAFQTDLKKLEEMVNEVKSSQSGKNDPAIV